ncbi:hypothetical protein [Vibrio sonorensis]|uniref:hypothetical protein n=1 Tax=Vibrio sonorensis TaxID=1004316 RepID=UPI0008D946B6|nr:hypothetical protein [Vibrio sonorensis]
MQKVSATIKDFQALAKAGLIGELVAFEINEPDVFHMVGISNKLATAFILHDGELSKERAWSGSRNLFDVAKKIGCRALTIKAFEKQEPAQQEPEQQITLSSGKVINFQ